MCGIARAVAADEKAASPLAKKAERLKERKTLVVGVRTLLSSPSFQAITFASALNDVGSWALVSWHATFYTRVFGLGPDIYAPMLAAIIPIGGIIGGVGSGLMGDWLSRTGNRHWLTSGVCLLSFINPSSTLAALFMFRAVSTSAAAYDCTRWLHCHSDGTSSISTEMGGCVCTSDLWTTRGHLRLPQHCFMYCVHDGTTWSMCHMLASVLPMPCPTTIPLLPLPLRLLPDPPVCRHHFPMQTPKAYRMHHFCNAKQREL